MRNHPERPLGKNVRGQNVRFLIALIAAIFIFVASDDKTCAASKSYGWVDVTNNGLSCLRVVFVSGLTSESVELGAWGSKTVMLESGYYAYTAFSVDCLDPKKLVTGWDYGGVNVRTALNSKLTINL